MIDINHLNWIAIIVASVFNMALGFFWYSPAGFGKKWAKLTGIDMMKMSKDEANKAIMFVGVGAIIQSIVLALILTIIGTTTIAEAIQTGLILWIGFIGAVSLGDILYARRGWGLWWLNSSYFLVIMIVNSILLTLWR